MSVTNDLGKKSYEILASITQKWRLSTKGFTAQCKAVHMICERESWESRLVHHYLWIAPNAEGSALLHCHRRVDRALTHLAAFTVDG